MQRAFARCASVLGVAGACAGACACAIAAGAIAAGSRPVRLGLDGDFYVARRGIHGVVRLLPASLLAAASGAPCRALRGAAGFA
jgi:hypothetical protein